jgi:hypothetical protein
MLKKVLFAAAVTGLAIGATLPIQATPADAASGCYKASMTKFPGAGHHKERHDYRKYCRSQYKAYKQAQKSSKKAAG